MKVYLAICDYGYEGFRIHAVCATRELAQKRIDPPHECSGEDHDIEEWEIEGLPDQP